MDIHAPEVVVPPKTTEPRPDRRIGWAGLAVSVVAHGLAIAVGLSAQFSHHPLHAVGKPEPVSVDIITETRPKELAPDRVTPLSSTPESAAAVPFTTEDVAATPEAEQAATTPPPPLAAALPSEEPATAAQLNATDAGAEVPAPAPTVAPQPPATASPVVESPPLPAAVAPPPTSTPTEPPEVDAAQPSAEALAPNSPPRASGPVDSGEALDSEAPAPDLAPQPPAAPAPSAAEGPPALAAAGDPPEASAAAGSYEVAAAQPPADASVPTDAPEASARVNADKALGSEAPPKEQHPSASAASELAAAQPETRVPGVSPEAPVTPDLVAPDAASAVNSSEAPPSPQSPPQQASASPGPLEVAAAEPGDGPLRANIVPDAAPADRTAPGAAGNVDAASTPRAQSARPAPAIASVAQAEPAAPASAAAPMIAPIGEAEPLDAPVRENASRLAPAPGAAALVAKSMKEAVAPAVTAVPPAPEAADRRATAAAVEVPAQASAAAPVVPAIPASATIAGSAAPKAEVAAMPTEPPLAAAPDAQTPRPSLGLPETVMAAVPAEPQAAKSTAPEAASPAAAPPETAPAAEATVAVPPVDAASASANPVAPVPPAAIAVRPTAIASAQPQATPAEIATVAPGAIVGIESGAPATPQMGAADGEAVAVISPPSTSIEPVDPDGRIDAVLKGLKCARVESEYALRGGNVELSGHVKTDSDLADLLAHIKAIPGVETISAANLYVVGEPYCDVLTLLARADRSREQRGDIKEIGNPAQAGVMRLTRGEPVKLHLKAPDFTAFLYVDYFSSDGKVFHLVPNLDYGDEPFTPGERFGLGNPGDPGPQVRVAPPFGLDMVVALGSSERLFVDKRPPAEDAHTYLAALAAAIDRVKEDRPLLKLEYAYHLIFTTDAASQ